MRPKSLWLAALLVLLCCATCSEGKRGKAGRVKTKREVVRRRLLSRDQVETFKRDGILVFEGALSQGEVNEALSGLHTSLERSGILVRADDGGLAITPNSAARMQLVGGGIGGIVDIFYEPWKLKVQENPRVLAAMSEIYDATYAKGSEEGLWGHPYGRWNSSCMYSYLDRVCFRLGNNVINAVGINKMTGAPLQYGLFGHVDAHPADRWAAYSRPPSRKCSKYEPPEGGYIKETCKTYRRRWRPIQAFVALSQDTERDTGGFEAYKGFHKIFGNDGEKGGAGYFEGCMTCSNSSWRSYQGYHSEEEFFSFRQDIHRDVLTKIDHISVPQGSLVMWDWRIPHRNAEQHFGSMPRSVIYTGYLPSVPLNRDYAREQQSAFNNFLPPPDFSSFQHLTEDTSATHIFSPEGRRLMTIDACGGGP